ncbi:MAG: efflux RND transporter periplasmic adaptor subunit [Bacteroidetes bacterium]|nr:efflux RND transporter periplasmic adaptor subunit [Bacteroidota bacterium]
MNKILFFSFIILLSACSRSGETVKPEKKDIIETVYASGKIISEKEYYLFALSNGTVKEKLVKDGDTVIKGQSIYVIRNEAPAARLDAARSSFENAESNLSPRSRVLNDLELSRQNADVKFRNDSLQYFRLKNLYDQNAASKNNVDNAFTNYTISKNQKKSAEEKYQVALNELNVVLHNAKSQMASAQTDLDNYFIRSENNGTVFQTFKEAGESVRMNEVVALLGETSGRIIKLSVDQQDIDKIKTGQEVLLKMDVTGNTIYHATVSRLYPVMNELDQTFRVDAVFKDSTQQQFIHSSVEANIIVQKKTQALVIPRNALLSEDSIRVKQDGKQKTIHVLTGIHTLDLVEITGGLDESTEVIIPSKK